MSLQAKPKMCSCCGTLQKLWKANPPMCKNCYGRSKQAELDGAKIMENLLVEGEKHRFENPPHFGKFTLKSEEMTDGKCLYCSTPTKKWGVGFTKFCNHTCGDRYRTLQEKFVPKLLICPICKIEFLQKNSMSKLCSKKCNGRYHNSLVSKKPETKSCKVCEKEYVPYTSLDKYCSVECRVVNKKSGRSFQWGEQSVKNRIGKNNPNYKHGLKVADINKKQKEYMRVRDKLHACIIEKDGYLSCQNCHKSNVKFETHHIVFRSERPSHEHIHNPKNLIVVCVPCHNYFHNVKSNRNQLVYDRGLEELFGNLYK